MFGAKSIIANSKLPLESGIKISYITSLLPGKITFFYYHVLLSSFFIYFRYKNVNKGTFREEAIDFNEFTDGLARPRSIWLNNDGVTSASFAKSRILKFCFFELQLFFP